MPPAGSAGKRNSHATILFSDRNTHGRASIVVWASAPRSQKRCFAKFINFSLIWVSAVLLSSSFQKLPCRFRPSSSGRFQNIVKCIHSNLNVVPLTPQQHRANCWSVYLHCDPPFSGEQLGLAPWRGQTGAPWATLLPVTHPAHPAPAPLPPPYSRITSRCRKLPPSP